MNRILLFLLLASVIHGCNAAGKEKRALLAKDYALADTLQYDHTVIDAVRETISGKINRLAPTSAKERSVTGLADALEFEYEVNTENSQDYERLRAGLRQQGYLLFKSEENFGTAPDRYAILRTRDQLDIVRFRATNGFNYDISNDSILTKLQEWRRQQSFEITGADTDWIEIHLDQLNPSEALAFAGQVYEFCPDLSEHGAGTVENLAAELLDTKSIFLWWD
ncbi:DUF4253 domain-containing protein [Chitinophaga rhizophila]|uniref:DUF4253 domain-containing protein n=1 Tax=Chitinophaga rhizophila TaxID=2866212 RepID=A0ABS7GMM3_9BACT|nr:DUF4253 domain-containing protein [Chitinophaga rhizophila]MBW8688112.1 DUF4253 domain-containing protein [Chitinophaga rhizophila]